jgi:DNA-binding NarL/FixJ family response regulator
VNDRPAGEVSRLRQAAPDEPDAPGLGGGADAAGGAAGAGHGGVAAGGATGADHGGSAALGATGGSAAGAAPPIRVVLADDQALIRGGLRALIAATPGIEVVGEAADGERALAVARELRPHVVLMDIRMPGVDGLEATRRITADEALQATRVLVLTTFEVDEYVFEALRAGASGFLLKDEEPVEILRAIEVVAAGDSLLSPSVTRRVVETFASGPATAPPALDELTGREREIVALVGTGLSNHEIADRLTISPATARTHVSRAMLKLGARDRAQLVVFAYESGLVSPGLGVRPRT